MREWRDRLEHWIRVWDRLSELSRDIFAVRPPAGGWPANLPRCAALADLYARCDGGDFGPFQLLRASDVTDVATGPLADEVGLDKGPGRWVHFGNHEYGHFILWNASADEVALYSPDDEEPLSEGRTEDFLQKVFNPPEELSADATQIWAESLAEADRIA